jgi:hypothetical protein
MPQMIHFQDDIFMLSVLVKALDTGLCTEADPDYFRERVLGDFGFIDSGIRVFLALLAQNELLVERAEYLKLLERTTKASIKVLERLTGDGYPRAADYRELNPRIENLLHGQRILLRDMETLLGSALSGQLEADLVSQDELSELLR